ncbi:MAG: FAD-binding protein [Bacteroidetes bacterium]|nr:FAD-binding protein [Bacteroidota bacterium]
MSKPSGHVQRKRKHRTKRAVQERPRLEVPVGQVEVCFPANLAAQPDVVAQEVADAAGWSREELGDYRVVRKNVDARRRPVKALWMVEVAQKGHALPGVESPHWHVDVLPKDAPEIIIVGAGPAGLFAALECLDQGLRPIIIERGFDVRQRRRDLVKITQDHLVNPDSNYCFGEGGAGTYSDGKLYTRSHKRGDIRSVLECLVAFGADPDILVEAHPHIGTNKLPGIIQSMREAIVEAGGEVHFGCRMVDLESDDGSIQAIHWLELNRGATIRRTCDAVILATGHSARDVFHLIHQKGWTVEAKPYALGVRVEHPQALIDQVQYHGEERGDWLPPAAYKLVCQVDGRGVHSFCMCPGGIIAPCATEQDQVVTNGWSPSKRNNPYANAGMVVQIDEAVWEEAGFTGPLAGLDFQRMVERNCCEAARKTQCAPAQRLLDFIAGDHGKVSQDLPTCSYMPGVVSVNLKALLPQSIAKPLAEGLRAFGRKMPEFLHPDAILVAPESRTSSPVRIPRDPVTLEHPDVEGLYPCGEGGGYAGGILSAALDGTRVVQMLATKRSSKKA